MPTRAKMRGNDPRAPEFTGARGDFGEDGNAMIVIEPNGVGPGLEIGFLSVAGRRAVNEDYAGIALGETAGAATRGVVVALADGMGGAAAGAVAAELAVRSFLEGYYQLPETLGPERAAARALDAANAWVHAQGRVDPRLTAMAATFAALILRGRQAYFLRAGDIRLYRLREGRLRRIGADHYEPAVIGGVVLRAVGLESSIAADCDVLDLAEGDRYLLCSDGLHRTLSDVRIAPLLAKADAQTAAQRLIEAAVAFGRDNASAVVLDVMALPVLDLHYLERVIGPLPIGDPPRSGDTVDGYLLGSVLYSGHYSRLFVAHPADQPQGDPVIVKFPLPRAEHDENIRRSFLRETWISGRVKSQYLIDYLPPEPGRQTRLYAVSPYYDGETLETRLQRSPVGLHEGIEIAGRLAKAIDTLNRREIFHRDVKPENVMLLRDGGLRLLDLGFSAMPGVLDPAPAEVPGTPAYMAPELFAGGSGDARSDVFAFGVTLYRMLSGGKSPYGLRQSVPLHRHRPDLPAYLSRVLEKGMARDPDERYQDVLELLYELEYAGRTGAPAGVARRRSLYERNPLLFWQVTAWTAIAVAFGLLVALAKPWT